MTVKQADLKASPEKEGVLRKFDEFFSGSKLLHTPNPSTSSQPIQSLKPNSVICPIRHHAWITTTNSTEVSSIYCIKEKCAWFLKCVNESNGEKQK